MDDSHGDALVPQLERTRGEVSALLRELDSMVGAPPEPDEEHTHLGGARRGWTWNPVQRWRVQVPVDPDDTGFVYLSHPHMWAGDVLALPSRDAHALAGAIRAAARRADQITSGVVFFRVGHEDEGEE